MWVPDLLLLDSDPEFVFVWCPGMDPSAMLGLFQAWPMLSPFDSSIISMNSTLHMLFQIVVSWRLSVAALAAVFSLFFLFMLCLGSIIYFVF
jgi:hypothetical protein